MCTLALYFQALGSCPLLVAANRDEFIRRPSAPPGRLCRSPWVFGGQDLRAGGTWLGINDKGMFAGILNRRSGVKRGESTKRSRGLLCLDLLKSGGTAEALDLLRRSEGNLYDPFNLVFASASAAYVAHNIAEGIECLSLEPGVHVVGNTSIYDQTGAKANHALDLFTGALHAMVKKPHARGNRPGNLDVGATVRFLRGVLSDHLLNHATNNPREAICVHRGDYGTVSSSILIPRPETGQYDYFHAAGPPCQNDYEQVYP